MKKTLLIFLVYTLSGTCQAKDFNSDELLSWITLTPSLVTKGQVTTILGNPLKVEENKKKTWWFYLQENSRVVLSWNNKSGQLEKFSFQNDSPKKEIFDTRVSGRLQSGVTDMKQAICILGMPKDMTLKEVTQEMHYAYKNSVLRLFFRNGLLVDFTLLCQK